MPLLPGDHKDPIPGDEPDHIKPLINDKFHDMYTNTGLTLRDAINDILYRLDKIEQRLDTLESHPAMFAYENKGE